MGRAGNSAADTQAGDKVAFSRFVSLSLYADGIACGGANLT
jgi:hypothetical protein